MKKFLEFVRNKHGLIFKILLFLIATSLIVFIFPREGKFKYEFTKGKPWPHEDLIAPFDFPIYKSEKVLVDEKESIVGNLKIYFFKSQASKNQALAYYQNEFDNTWPLYLENRTGVSLATKKIRNQLYHLGEDILVKLFNDGIIELHSSIEDKTPDYEILVIEDNIAKAKALKQLRSIQEAFDFANKALTQIKKDDADFLLDLIEVSIRHNVSYDAESNKLATEEAIKKISPTLGMIQKGERVISTGDILNLTNYQILESLKKEYELQIGGSKQMYYILAGQAILVILMISSLALFLVSFRKEIIQSDRKITFILLSIVLFVFAAKAILNVENINLYLLPFCILPLVIRTFFDIRVALFSHLVTILIIGFFAPNPYEFIIIQMITGIISIFGILNLRNRSQLFMSSLIIFIIYSLSYLGIGLIQEGSLAATNWKFFGWFFGSAILTLFTYPLVYIFEKIFGFVSDVTLMELADTNNKLLRQLNNKAPGTFQHSLQVSNLAEEAINEIGGNTLLVRTGAMYHDIGKMNMPNYFIENQNTDYNPHDDLSPEESAKVIIDHVIHGIEMAKKHNLPDIIIDFIRTHHGTSKTQYFLKNYKNEQNEQEVDESIFQYPGPTPYSKETAVLMMADSVEAASRSLKSYDGESIETLVNGIIDAQVAELQFINSNITFSDISQIKKIFKRKLMNIYHVRVEYPE